MDDQAAAQQAAQPPAALSSPAPTAGAATPAGSPHPVGRQQAAPVAGRGDVPGDVRLTREEAEQVIRRALELQDDQQGAVEPALSMADLQDIARQLGVDPALVRRARAEVRVRAVGEEAPSRAERLLGPRHVTDARLVPASEAAVRVAAAEWMASDEGMTRTGTRGQTERWVRDKRLLVAMRRGLQADRGSGVLRDLDGVALAVTPDPEGTIVTVQADTSKVRTAGGVVAGIGTALSTAVGVGAAAALPDSALLGPDAAQFAVVFLPAMAVNLGTTLAVTRTWTRKVRTAVDQALDGITMTTDAPQLPRLPDPADGGWRGQLVRWLGGRG